MATGFVCTACREPVKEGARRCPHCGAHFDSKVQTWGVRLGCMVPAVIALLLFASFLFLVIRG